VTTVVTKLFHLVRPHAAVFGEKDYQQLVVVRRMVADLGFGIDVVGVQTVREPDGLAMSSRNRRLGRQARAAARCVPRALRAAVESVATGERAASRILAAVRAEIESEPLARLEYAEIRDAEALEAVERLGGAARLALAVWIDGVRLIDNCALEATGAGRAPRVGPDAADVGRGERATVGGGFA
jgi:pantoate--beta-alanine ligase